MRSVLRCIAMQFALDRTSLNQIFLKVLVEVGSLAHQALLLCGTGSLSAEPSNFDDAFLETMRPDTIRRQHIQTSLPSHA
jgi:hypothetical protein